MTLPVRNRRRTFGAMRNDVSFERYSQTRARTTSFLPADMSFFTGSAINSQSNRTILTHWLVLQPRTTGARWRGVQMTDDE
jgi:hypothetical protein